MKKVLFSKKIIFSSLIWVISMIGLFLNKYFSTKIIDKFGLDFNEILDSVFSLGFVTGIIFFFIFIKNYSNLIFNRIIGSLFIISVFSFLIFDGKNWLEFSTDGQTLVLRLRDLLSIFLGIIVEATPFVVLGVIVSILVGLFIKESLIKRLLPKNRFLSHILISFMGVLMPVCECGNVPVARRLVMNGFSVSQSITFLLAAPILNPLTLLTTYEAFGKTYPSVVIFRIIGAFIIANFVGILISFKKNQNDLLTEDFYNLVCEVEEHEHSRIEKIVDIFKTEFFEVFKMLILGAFLASISQTFIPRNVIEVIGSNPVFSILAMILLAFVISICSNVDAFFAYSYSSTFTIGSIVSFLVFGPMIDIKILTMLKGTFKLKFLLMIALLVFILSYLFGLIISLYV